MAILPRLSIATKLYAIFALLAIATVILAVTAVIGARHHNALTREFEAAYQGAQNVERLNGLIYAVRLESRGIYMSPDAETAKQHAILLRTYNDRIGDVVTEWQWIVDRQDAPQFETLSDRIKQYQEFTRYLIAKANETELKTSPPGTGLEADSSVRVELNKGLEAFGQLYSHRAKRAYAQIDRGIETTAWITSLLSAAAILLAAAGALMIWRNVVRPLAQITRITETVAEGTAVAIPYGTRRDEIGALARSIAVFQHAMHHNKELNDKVLGDAEARTLRQGQVAAEIERFSAEVEAGIAELGAICDQMLDASTALAGVADRASLRTAGATQASTEASSNVRDIASAADELAASVMEIDRQVGHSNAIAEKAVVEAERTNETAEEVSRVGDATENTRSSVTTVKAVADELGAVAGRIRGQVDAFFGRLRAA